MAGNDGKILWFIVANLSINVAGICLLLGETTLGKKIGTLIKEAEIFEATNSKDALIVILQIFHISIMSYLVFFRVLKPIKIPKWGKWVCDTLIVFVCLCLGNWLENAYGVAAGLLVCVYLIALSNLFVGFEDLGVFECFFSTMLEVLLHVGAQHPHLIRIIAVAVSGCFQAVKHFGGNDHEINKTQPPPAPLAS